MSATCALAHLRIDFTALKSFPSKGFFCTNKKYYRPCNICCRVILAKSEQCGEYSKVLKSISSNISLLKDNISNGYTSPFVSSNYVHASFVSSYSKVSSQECFGGPHSQSSPFFQKIDSEVSHRYSI